MNYQNNMFHNQQGMNQVPVGQQQVQSAQQQQPQQQQQQFQAYSGYSSSSASYAYSGGYSGATGGNGQQMGQGYQQQQHYQQHQQQYVQSGVVSNPTLQAKTPSQTTVTQQTYYVQANEQRLFNNGGYATPQVNAGYQRPMLQSSYDQNQNPNAGYGNMNYGGSYSNLQEQPQQNVYSQPQYAVSEPIITEPPDSRPSSAMMEKVSSPTSPRTNLLSHKDGNLLVQEAFLSSGIIDIDTGYAHVLDLQGIWAKTKSSNGEYEMKLSMRMANASQNGIYITDLTMTILPNAFGLMIVPGTRLLPVNPDGGQILAPGQTHTSGATLICSRDNQQIPTDPTAEWTEIFMVIEYKFSEGIYGAVRPIRVSHSTLVPMHIFFQEHPQMEYVSRLDIEPQSLSSSEFGPRLDQNTFLDLWKSQLVREDQTRSFAFSGVPWARFFDQFAKQGVLFPITGSNMPSENPSAREIIRVMEHKLSMNRVYVVASREVPKQQYPELVFFVSFTVGEKSTGSCMVLGEVRLAPASTGDIWSGCQVALKTRGNAKLFPGIERAFRAILLS
ncbi:hypothetical protein MP638_000734 [Amoeboaphelidium occidentale]|nr:hypothetical protein MP638_000734 [Amoeboaphelidium occidentale]